MPKHLDEVRMQAAAQQFVGTHDFLALCAAGSSAAAHGDTVRTITDCHVTRRGDEIDIEVTADGYLYNMVRILAGTLCEVGAGRMQPEEIPGILAGCDPQPRREPTPASKGLFLIECGMPGCQRGDHSREDSSRRFPAEGGAALDPGQVSISEAARQRARNRRLRRGAIIVAVLTVLVLFATGAVGTSIARARIGGQCAHHP